MNKFSAKGTGKFQDRETHGEIIFIFLVYIAGAMINHQSMRRYKSSVNSVYFEKIGKFLLDFTRVVYEKNIHRDLPYIHFPRK